MPSQSERYWRCEFGHRFAADPESETCPDRDHDGSWCGAPVRSFVRIHSSRPLSMSREQADRYLAAMGLEPVDD